MFVNSDFSDLLQIFNAKKVKYLVIGRLFLSNGRAAATFLLSVVVSALAERGYGWEKLLSEMFC